jgi:hypothetical protein
MPRSAQLLLLQSPIFRPNLDIETRRPLETRGFQ